MRKTWLINQVVRDYGETAAILSLTADNDTVYGSGYAFGGTKGYFEGAFAARPSDGKVQLAAGLPRRHLQRRPGGRRGLQRRARA